MSIQKAYNDWSSSYDIDKNLTRDLDQQTTQAILSGRRFNSILEIGCGTGKNTVFLAEIGIQVHAIDFSEGMIEKAREKVRGSNVRFSLADLTKRWPCDDQSYDLVVCNLVLEHIEDLTFIFSEVARCLGAGGSFLLNELHPFRQYEGKKARFSTDTGAQEILAFVHHISDFIKAASEHGLQLARLDERWHPDDSSDKPPRIVSFLFEKP